MKKSRLLLLLLLICVSLFAVSCKGGSDGDSGDGDVDAGGDVAANEFVVNELTIGGVDISEFSIIKGSGLSTMDSLIAQKLAEKIYDVCGVEIPVKNSGEAETAHEILIGNTGRALSSATLDSGLASAVQKDGKIALYGNGSYAVTYSLKYFINDVLGAIPAQDKYDIQMAGFESLAFENPNLAGTNMPIEPEDLTGKYDPDFTNNANVVNRFYNVIGEFPEHVSVLPRYTTEDFPLIQKNQIYVAPNGNDENEGTIDAPLASLAAAAKKLKDKNGGIIWMRGGSYNEQAISAVSGTPVSPIFIAAYPGETPLITTGKQIPVDEFMDVNYSSDTLAQRIPASAQSSIAYVNLYKLGWTAEEIGGIDEKQGPAKVYINGAQGELARYPNAGEPELYFDYVFESGSCSAGSEHSHLYNDWIKRVKAGEFDHMDASLFYTDREGNRNINIGWSVRLRDLTPCTWENTGDIWYFGNVFAGWHSAYYNIESFDLLTRKMTSKTECVYGAQHSTNSATGFNNYYLFNAIEALDAPGEWFFDRESGNFYIHKTADFEGATILYAASGANAKDAVTIKNCKNVIFDGITASASSAVGISVIECDGVIVQGCTVNNTQSYGIKLGSKSVNCAATYNDVSRTQDSMIFASPESYYSCKLTSSRLIVQNNYCHDPRPSIIVGITLGGYMSVASHNYLEDCRISLTWSSECMVEYNDISGGSRDVYDAGLFYLVGYYHHGNHIRYNYLHNWGTPHSGIYFDDLSSGNYAYYNIIDSTSATGKNVNMFFVSSGHYNVLYGNLLIGRKSDYIHESTLYFDDNSSLGYRFPMRVDTYIDNLSKAYDLQRFYKRFPEVKQFYDMMKQHHTDSNKAGYVRNELEIYLRSPANNIIMNNILLGMDNPIDLTILKKTNSVTKQPMESTSLVTNNYINKDVSAVITNAQGGDYTILPEALSEIKSTIPDYYPLSIDEVGLTYER